MLAQEWTSSKQIQPNKLDYIILKILIRYLPQCNTFKQGLLVNRPYNLKVDKQVLHLINELKTMDEKLSFSRSISLEPDDLT